MTYDESNAAITEHLTGRTIDCVARAGTVLEFHTSCGRTIKLQADVNGDIHFLAADVSIKMPSLRAMAQAGSVQVGR